MIVQWVNKWNLGLFNKNLNIKYFSININNNLDNKNLRFNNTIDCFDKLKAYYQAKNKKKVFFKNIQNYKQFLINIKKAKLTYNESKIFIRNGILSSCVISNIVYVIKKRNNPKLINDWFKFFRYSFPISLLLNYLIQIQLKKKYEDQIQKIDDI
jgi:hypothetical protein